MPNENMSIQLQKSIIEDHKTQILELKHYKKISSFLRKLGVLDLSQEDIYCTVHDIIKPACNRMRFVSFSVGYRSCSKSCECYKSILSEKIKDIKFSYSENEKSAILNKRKNTVNTRYGVDNVFQSASIIQKSLHTKLEKYNNIHYNNRSKAQETSMNRFGTDNPAKSEEIKEKAKRTNLSRYGTESPLLNKEIQSKIKTTLYNKYGVLHPMHSDIVKDRVKETNFGKFGVTNAAQRHFSQEAIAFLDNETEFREQVCKKSVFDLAEEYKISLTPIYDRIKKYDIKDRVMSGFQASVYTYIKEIYNGEVQVNTRTTLSDAELDIYIPEFKLAIECNGTYWHSELNGRDRHYHGSKTDKCNALGISLLHVWEHTWYSNSDVIKSIIGHKLGVSAKIYARRCELTEITSAESKKFLDNNHIQGGTNASKSYALVLDDKIVSVMTFGKSRFNKSYEWELLRFSSLLNTVVIGAASRLFKYFIRSCNPATIITYSDCSIMSGSVYKLLGFKYNTYSRPSYFYTLDYKTVYHRINFQKKRLPDKLPMFNSELTEWQNMQINGYDRIWDCGNDVWTWSAAQELI